MDAPRATEDGDEKNVRRGLEKEVDVSTEDHDHKRPIDNIAAGLGKDTKLLLETETRKQAEYSELVSSVGSEEGTTVKLFLCGDGQVGKTSLAAILPKTGFLECTFRNMKRRFRKLSVFSPTPGVAVAVRNVRGIGRLSVHDFAGQAQFYVTHAMLLRTTNAIFPVVYKITDGEEEQKRQARQSLIKICNLDESPQFIVLRAKGDLQVEGWLTFIHCSNADPTNKPRIVLIASNADKLQNKDDKKRGLLQAEGLLDHFTERFQESLLVSPEVFLINCKEAGSREIQRLREVLAAFRDDMLKQRPQVPKVCVQLSENIEGWRKMRKTFPVMGWQDYLAAVRQASSVNLQERIVQLASSYLHDEGEIIYLRHKTDSSVVLDPQWLFSSVFGPLLAPDNFPIVKIARTGEDYVTLEELTRVFSAYADIPLLIKLLQDFQLCHTNDGRTFILPSLLQQEMGKAAWSPVSSKAVYFGLQIRGRTEIDSFSCDLFPRLQTLLMQAHPGKLSRPLLWNNSAKCTDGKAEALLQITTDRRQLNIFVRSTKGIREHCTSLMDLLKDMTYRLLHETSPGARSRDMVVSALDLQEHMPEPHAYSREEVEAAAEAAAEDDRTVVNPKRGTPEEVKDLLLHLGNLKHTVKLENSREGPAEDIEELIRKNYPLLRERLQVSDLFPHLIQRGLLQIEEKEDINSKTTTQGKAEALLDLLMRQGKCTCDDFVEILRIGNHEHIVIDRTMNRWYFLQAARDGDVEKVRRGLEEGLDVNTKDWTVTRKQAEYSELVSSVGSEEWTTVKLFLCGDGQVGKTSLRAILKKTRLIVLWNMRRRFRRQDVFNPTPGVHVSSKTVRGIGRLSLHDFAGQAQFYVTHAMLLRTTNAILPVVYKITDGEEIHGWLSFIHCSNADPTNKPRIVLIASHADKLEDQEAGQRRATALVEHYRKVFQESLIVSKEVFLINCLQAGSREIQRLRAVLAAFRDDILKQRPKFPKVCNSLLAEIEGWRQERKEFPVMGWQDYLTAVEQATYGFVKERIVELATSYLHDEGEIIFLRNEANTSVVLDPHWLFTSVFGSLLAPENFNKIIDMINRTAEDYVTLEELTRVFSAVADIPLLIKLLQDFQLCHTYDGRTFILPSLLQQEMEEAAWSHVSSKAVYFGLQIRGRMEIDSFSCDLFPRLQTLLMQAHPYKLSRPLLWKNSAKCTDGKAEALLQITQDKRQLNIFVRSNDGSREDCNSIMDFLKDMTYRLLHETSPGARSRDMVLSALDLREHRPQPHAYSREEVEAAAAKGENLVHSQRNVPEKVSGLLPHYNLKNKPKRVARRWRLVHPIQDHLQADDDHRPQPHAYSREEVEAATGKGENLVQPRRNVPEKVKYLGRGNGSAEELIKQNYPLLRERLQVSDLFPHLIQRGLLQIEEKEDINSRTTRQGKAEALIDLLSQQGKCTCDDFVEILRIGNHEHIVGKLK
uniref:CARD domain-containing protein n=1 Tax=Branchiostoma floridae TaxID=7739 RepID=C3YHV6_BRAFL|eukprot:XP_002604082.1 hypothetical protein BRAFLDRAFT_71628 [Branchiostoma floridae]